MPTYDQLYKRTQQYVRDRALDGEIPDALNEALTFIHELENPHILLPALKTSATVTAGISAAHVAMPTDYSKHLFCVRSTAYPEDKIDICPGMSLFLKQWPELELESGPIEEVCIDPGEDVLYYQPGPTTADTLELHYYASPTAIDPTLTAEVTVIPANHQYTTLCRLAAFFVLEQAGQMEAAEIQFKMFDAGIKRLHDAIKNTYERAQIIKRTPGQYI